MTVEWRNSIDLSWVEAFRGKKGRPLRVLHIGNVANNAYYVARFLNCLGIHADVFGSNNYHVMASPEWEEMEIEGAPGDLYSPDWASLDMGGYERPRWFAQGPSDLCASYLRARVRKEWGLAEERWGQLERARRAAHSYRRIIRIGRELDRILGGPVWSRIKDLGRSWIAARGRGGNEEIGGSQVTEDGRPSATLVPPESLVEEFARRFPDRRDRLTPKDLARFHRRAAQLKSLFPYYDIVHAYGTEVIYPCLTGTRPFVAWEHGTLRDSPWVSWEHKGPFYANPIGRLVALGYALADHVFVTNADNLANVQRLGIQSFSAIGHPFDDRAFAHAEDHPKRIRARIGAEFLMLCPIRHDWLEKGVDKYIRALPALRRALGNRFRVCFMPWGQEVARSRRLIRALGCEDIVEWIGPFGHVWFTRWLMASDVVYDQLAYSSFSGTTPRALACGVPLIAKYDPQVMSAMFPEPAPVLAADSVQAVVDQTLTAIAPGFRREYGHRARDWIERFHSRELIVGDVLRAYRRLIEPEKRV